MGLEFLSQECFVWWLIKLYVTAAHLMNEFHQCFCFVWSSWFFSCIIWKEEDFTKTIFLIVKNEITVFFNKKCTMQCMVQHLLWIEINYCYHVKINLFSLVSLKSFRILENFMHQETPSYACSHLQWSIFQSSDKE